MPIYEYEPVDRDCQICSGRIEVIQKHDEPALEYCPTCGLSVGRVVSQASFHVDRSSIESAGKKGFTTFRRLEKGRYEKVSGEGPNVIDAPDPASD